MDLQEMFDKLAVHLLKQNRVSRIGIRCAYRGENGRMCAAGPVFKNEIADSPYNTGCSPEHVPDEYWIDPSIKDDNQLSDLLLEMQKIHDNSLPEDWPVELDEIAVHYKLNTDAIGEWL